MITKNSIIANLKEGWHVNDNEKIVESIIRRCNANNGLCPCHHPADDGDLHCPCESYRLRDKCCCNLYVKNDER